MGTIEMDTGHQQLIIRANILLYGSCATPELAARCADEIETMWSEPMATVRLGGIVFTVVFRSAGYCFAKLAPENIFDNRNPANNYFRVEEQVAGNISFVDGLHCNTGYFKLENLYAGSTTAAHEFGHTIGLDHPADLDYRGRGVPGIMFPRGTLVDAQYQYDPAIPAGEKGGTLHPKYRRVKKEDIDALRLQDYNLRPGNTVMIGDYSSVYHEAHPTNEV